MPIHLLYSLMLITLGYASLCAVSPFGHCRKCRGWGHQIRTDRRGRPRPGRVCRRCHGDRYRPRIGRLIYNRITAEYRTGHNTAPATTKEQ